jgi:spore coat polysaccharide biosynthesis predicted glycosyltransferase SpsG
MRYVLRADASQSIGSGHVMRSSAIAEELIARGEIVVFVGQISDLPWVMERIGSLGFSRIFSQSVEFDSIPATDVLILDSYHIDVNDSFITPNKWRHIIAIVDEMTPNYTCTIKVHPSINSEWVEISQTPILAGPKYIPLRSSLSKYVQKSYNEQKNLKIVVVAGGSDPHKLVPEIAKVLSNFSESFEVYLFLNSSLDLVLDSRFHFIEVGQQLDEITKDADLVLTTASTSSLEFLARGICVGLICAVDNQRANYDSLGKFGVAAQLGIRTLGGKWELDEQKIYSLIKSKELRMDLKTRALGLIDFSGARRIVDAIITLKENG